MNVVLLVYVKNYVHHSIVEHTTFEVNPLLKNILPVFSKRYKLYGWFAPSSISKKGDTIWRSMQFRCSLCSNKSFPISNFTLIYLYIYRTDVPKFS